MRKPHILCLATFPILLAVGCTAETDSAPEPEGEPANAAAPSTPAAARGTPHVHPTRASASKVPTIPEVAPSQFMSATTPALPYNGGGVLGGTKKLFIVWYGAWTNTPGGTIDIVEDFARNIGGTPYFKINETYYDNAGHLVNNAVTFGKSTIRGYTKGNNLSDDDVANIVEDEIDSGNFPADYNGVYIVVGSADVNQSGSGGAMCSQYCGWHNYEQYASVPMKYVYLGSGNRCPAACEWDEAPPNGNAEADTLVSILSHELEETSTDPQLDAWTGMNGENADLCAWTSGDLYSTPYGWANMHVGDRDYHVQQNWINAGNGGCMLKVDLARPAAGVGTRTADFNGDGRGDLLFRDSASGATWLWLMSGATELGKFYLGSPSADWEIYGIADMNGDKHQDIVWRHSKSAEVSVWFMNGATKIGHMESSADATWAIAGLQTMPGGTSRILMRNLSTGALDGLSFAGGVVSVGSITGGVPWSWKIVGTGDFNGDHLGDILWQDTSGTVSAWLMNGNTLLGNSNMGQTAPILAIGDLDGDGTHDFVVRENTFNIVRKLVKNGYISSSGVIAQADPGFRLDGAVDLNGDGRDDFLWRDRHVGDLGMWLIGSGGTFSSSAYIEFGVSHDLEMIQP